MKLKIIKFVKVVKDNVEEIILEKNRKTKTYE